MIKFKQELLTDEIKAKINAGFLQHAIATVGSHDRGDIIAFVAYDGTVQDRSVFAGAVCVQLFWGQLHIKYVYVEPAYRQQGIASKLIQNAFDYGRSYKCTFAFVETMSFQAPNFYTKLGFTVDFTRTGFVNDISYHYLKCNL